MCVLQGDFPVLAFRACLIQFVLSQCKGTNFAPPFQIPPLDFSLFVSKTIQLPVHP